VALVAYNIQSVVKGAMRGVHGTAKVEEEVSGYYMAREWAAVYAGMMIALPASEWEAYREMPLNEFASLLRELARKVKLDRFKKQKRGPKKKPTPRVDDGVPHRSTARVLRDAKGKAAK